MARAASPARLLKKRQRSGNILWIIRHEGKDIGTGCAESDVTGAQEALASYVKKIRLNVRTDDAAADELLLRTVMSAYANEHAPTTASESLIIDHITKLENYWGDKVVSEVKGSTCREYVEGRGGKVIGRRELETLRAAVTYYHREYGISGSIPKFTMPPKSAPRSRWLTRSEAARLLLATRDWEWDQAAGRMRVPDIARHGHRQVTPHMTRFILIGVYTGSRSSAIKSARWSPSKSNSWFDLDAGVFHRKGSGERETKKRRPPVKLPRRLLAHLRRWREADQKLGIDHVIHYRKSPVASVKKGFGRSCQRAGLNPIMAQDEDEGPEDDDEIDLGDRVVPHTLRHTRATWLMQAGVDLWSAAASLGMTVKMLEEVYGHHHPDFQKDAADAY